VEARPQRIESRYEPARPRVLVLEKALEHIRRQDSRIMRLLEEYDLKPRFFFKATLDLLSHPKEDISAFIAGHRVLIVLGLIIDDTGDVSCVHKPLRGDVPAILDVTPFLIWLTGV
jgi:hypothetical protein